MSTCITENSTLLDQQSHELIPFSTGEAMPPQFDPPLIVSLDEEFADGEMASMYLDPAVIVRKELLAVLQRLGVDNIEVFPVIIKDYVHNTQITDDYVFINILGRVACADLSQSDYGEIGPDMRVMNEVVIDSSRTHGLEFFLLHEDTDCIIVSKRIHDGLIQQGFDDLFFEKLRQV